MIRKQQRYHILGIAQSVGEPSPGRLVDAQLAIRSAQSQLPSHAPGALSKAELRNF